MEEADKCVTAILAELYGWSMARALKYLLDNVSEPVRQCFAHTYMAPETLACHATVTIVVRPLQLRSRRTATMGRVAIFMRDACGREHPLQFSTQVATVYYLMHLITRRQHIGSLPPICLQRNADMFMELYSIVYDQRADQVKRRYHSLLYRVVDGKIRTGRLGETISDIRRHLSQAFLPTGESFVPYAMTARTHLSVQPHMIVFEDDTQRLLNLQFR